MRRRAVIALHWSTVFLLLALVKGGTQEAAWRWAFVLAGDGWLVVMALGGPLGRPGPKLGGWAKTIYHPAHLGMYALLAGAVGLNLAALLALAPLDAAWAGLIVLLCAAPFHAIFHLWRHTALNDGALRAMTPRIAHKHL